MPPANANGRKLFPELAVGWLWGKRADELPELAMGKRVDELRWYEGVRKRGGVESRQRRW